MSVADQINALRAKIPGCRVVAFGDLSTKLVLKASHAPEVRRETLDHLCLEAASCFDLHALGGGVSKPFEDALVLTGDEMRIYMHGAVETSDVLCLSCDLSADPEHVAALGRQTLSELSGAE